MAHMHAYRWNEAEQEFKRAIAADSALATAHTQFGRFLLQTGRVPDALRELQTARRLDPLSGTATVWLSAALSLVGNHAAWEESKRAQEIDPNLMTVRTILPLDRISQHRFDEARAIAGKDPAPIPFNGMMAYILQVTGDTARASAIRKSLDATPDTTWLVALARGYAYLPIDTAKALSAFESGVARREFVPQWEPFPNRMFDPVRQSARFAEIVRRSGLEGRGLTGPMGGRPAP
jgi:tetratricopeptide (TPR) repeat protein